MSAGNTRQFVDTNVLIYAHDSSAGSKREQAKQLVTELWDNNNGCLSIQVLQEFYVKVTQKRAKPLTSAVAAQIISDLATWEVHEPTVADIQTAIRLQRRSHISFWLVFGTTRQRRSKRQAEIDLRQNSAAKIFAALFFYGLRKVAHGEAEQPPVLHALIRQT